MFRFNEIIVVYHADGLEIPYLLKENAPHSAFSLIVRLINPDGSIERKNEVLSIEGKEWGKDFFLYEDYAEYERALTFEKVVKRMFSGK